MDLYKLRSFCALGCSTSTGIESLEGGAMWSTEPLIAEWNAIYASGPPIPPPNHRMRLTTDGRQLWLD